MARGFLGTAASRKADITLLMELGMGLVLVVGAWLARRRCYRAHAWCQSAVVLLNLAVIVLNMAPSLHRAVAAASPTGYRDSYYLLAGAHGILGIAAEMLALYILLAAGTNLLPTRLRFVHYKPWMQTALALWWAALLLGILTYVRWYFVPLIT
jgi:uncharacterized membrane protein YozB (DUF420 family)